MHRLQELVRLHRMAAGKREVARVLRISPNTERQYRQALDAVGLLMGPIEELPAMATLKAAVEQALPPKRSPQQMSSIDTWTEAIARMLDRAAQPQAIYDCLRLTEPTFAGSLSAVKRLVQRLRGTQEVKRSGAIDAAAPRVIRPSTGETGE